MKKSIVPYIRPVLYNAFQKGVIALTLILLWGRFINKDIQPWVSNGCFTAGAVFLALAWFAYLRLDGIRISPPNRKGSPRFLRRGGGDLADFVDEHIISLSEMSHEERLRCILASRLLCAGIFLAASAAAGIPYLSA